MLITKTTKHKIFEGRSVYGLLNAVPSPWLVGMTDYAGYDFAISKARVLAQGNLPECWPDFPAVGLDVSLRDNRRLIPMHPHFWDIALTQYLSDSDLDGLVHLAPNFLWRPE